MSEKKCPECGGMLEWDGHYQAYECTRAGGDHTFNAVLQPLRPIRDWANEFDEDDYDY